MPIVSLFTTGVALAQSRPAFEVASIRLNTSGDGLHSYSRGLMPSLAGPLPPAAPGAVQITNAPLIDIVARAYGMHPSLDRTHVQGGPSEVLSKRFDIRATKPDGTPSDQLLEMLQTLLAERFGLRVHTELRPTPGYRLVVARAGRLGPQMIPSTHDCAAFWGRGPDSPLTEPIDTKGQYLCRRDMQFSPPGVTTLAYASDTAFLTERLRAILSAPVIDATGLEGSFEWRVTWSPRQDADAPAPSLSTALTEQLGLTLERVTASAAVLIIDAVSMPTDN